jgi:hypothetical protein
MIRSQKYLSTFSGGVDSDTSHNKYPNTHYFDAENMRIISNHPSASGALSNVAGNTLKLTFDTGDVIIGFCKIRSNYTEPSKDSIVFFTYNATGVSSRIYIFEGDPYMVTGNISMVAAFHTVTGGAYNYKCGLLYKSNDLNFSASYPIKAEGRYESEDLRKVYWVDGLNNMRYMIIDRLASTDPVTIFDINPTATLPAPTVSLMNGGSYLAGTVQYSYQLYIKNGAATTFSPPSALLKLTAYDGGADSRMFAGSNLGDNTGKAVQITLGNLDDNYNRVRVVAIHYTENLVNPTINIVGEMEYDSTYATMIDNGYSVYGTIPIEEFRLFGQTNYIAGAIASKNNYLFIADVTEDKWNPDFLDPTDPTFWDPRAVRYNTYLGINAAIVNDGTTGNLTIDVPTNHDLPADWVTAHWDSYVITHDGKNSYNSQMNDAQPLNDFKYMSDLTTLGAEGPNIEITFEQETLKLNDNTAANYVYVNYPYVNTPTTTWHTSSQRTEVYRMYIVFYNKKMQYSTPQWIIDLKMPSNNDILTVDANHNGVYIYPAVKVKNLPTDPDLYGWQIFRCDRGSIDRSVLASGIISPCEYTAFGGIYNMTRPRTSVTAPTCFIKAEDIAGLGAAVKDRIIEIVSPEISFNKNLAYVSGDQLRVEGRYDQLYSTNTAATDSGFVLLSTTVVGHTKVRNAGDGVLYTIDEGQLQSLGLISGDPPVYPEIQSLGGESYRHVTRFDAGGGPTHYYGNHGSCFIAVLHSDLSVAAASTGFIYGSYIRNVANTQYGGNTYEARSYNSVIPYSDIVPVVSSTVTCYYGDTYISYFAYLRSSIPDLNFPEADNDSAQQEMVYIPVESSINCFYRLDRLQKYYSATKTTYKLQETLEQGMVLQPLDYPLELGNLYRYNAVYSKSANAKLLQNIVFDSNTIEHSDIRIMATGKKINNEYFDSWTNLYTNNYIEIDPRFGPIRNIFNFNNKLFTGQDKAICVLAVQDRSMIQDNSKLQLTLGTGGVLERYDYLTTTSGFQNYFDMCLSDKSFYYLDRRNKIIYMLTSEGDVPISEIGGYRSYLKSFGVMSTVQTGYDPIYKEVFFHITDGTITSTSVYNEYTSSFNGKHTFTPTRMFNLNDQFYSITGNTAYLHNYGDYGKFYGTVSDSTFTGIINPNGNMVNRFDVIELRVDVVDSGTYPNEVFSHTEQFDHMELSNNYQTLNKAITFSEDGTAEDTSRLLIRKWRTQLIPDLDSTDVERLVDTYLKIKLIKHNTSNKRLLFHDIITYTRQTKN